MFKLLSFSHLLCYVTDPHSVMVLMACYVHTELLQHKLTVIAVACFNVILYFFLFFCRTIDIVVCEMFRCLS